MSALHSLTDSIGFGIDVIEGRISGSHTKELQVFDNPVFAHLTVKQSHLTKDYSLAVVYVMGHLGYVAVSFGMLPKNPVYVALVDIRKIDLQNLKASDKVKTIDGILEFIGDAVKTVFIREYDPLTPNTPRPWRLWKSDA